MSLLVDPDYFLRALQLNYIRRLPDPSGPSTISFSDHHRPPTPTPPPPPPSDQPLPEPGPSTPRRQPPPSSSSSSSQNQNHPRRPPISNPYIQLSGLSDSQRWPELLVRGSPPEPFCPPTNPSNDQTPIRTRRRRADGAQPPTNHQLHHPSGTGLRYSETIVGPKANGLSAGMRVSGRKSIRASRNPSSKLTDSDSTKLATTTTTTTPTLPPEPAPNLPFQQQDDQINHQLSNPSAHALALTEGRASVIPGGGLNPEESDDDQNSIIRSSQQHLTQDDPSDRKPISRNPTNSTIKNHRRRISAVTFANNPLSFASPPGSILNLSFSRRTRAQRGHSISSIATTNTVLSSDFSEHANQTLNSPTPSQLPASGEVPLSHQNSKSAHADSTQSTDQPSSPQIPTPVDTAQTNADIFYSHQHDPDKRMSDMLFTYRPFDSKRATQIVGKVELEPAPLLEADNEEDTGDEEDIETDQTDTGTELGEDDSIYNMDGLAAEDSGLMDDGLSHKSRAQQQSKREAGSAKTSSFDLTPSDSHSIDQNSSIILSSSTTDSTTNIQNQSSGLSSQNQSSGPSSPPILRHRERRRVNIKMGKLLGPPIIEEDSMGHVIESDLVSAKVIPQAPGSTLKHPRAISSKSRPSLPDLRQALQTPSCIDSTKESLESNRTSTILNSNSSPARARAVTTPTPIPSVETNPNNVSTAASTENVGKDPKESPSILGARTFPRNRSGSGPATNRLRRSLIQQAGPGESPATNTTLRANQISKPSSRGTAAGGRAAKPSGKNKRSQLTFKKIELEDPKLKKPVIQKSILTQMLTANSSSSSAENPFRCFYALLASKERNALKITLYYPFSKEPSKPIKISMKADVCVEEVVGFGLWNYVEESREPKIDEIKEKPEALDLQETAAWCLRLVEDDGEVDEDFPALERTRPAAKVGSNEFAIVMATEAQAKQNESAQAQIQRRPSRVLGEPKRVVRGSVDPPGSVNSGAGSLLPPPINSLMGNSGTIYDGTRTIGGGVSDSLMNGGYGSMSLGGASLSGLAVYLKIRIPSPGKGVDSIITTMNVSMDMYLADVMETLVKKKGLGHAKDWALLVPSSPSIPVYQRDIIVPLDRTVQSLQGVNSLALVKRTQVSSKLLRNTQLHGNLSSQNTNPSASIFKRLSEIPQPKYVSITDLTSSSKTYLVQTKRRGILGKSDRLLTIEDDYVHISPYNHSVMIPNNPNGNHHNVGANGGSHGFIDALNASNPAASSSGKVASYHISQIVDCVFRPQAGFKLFVVRDSGEKRYDVEAENHASAIEIVRHIKGLKEMYHT